MASSEPPVFQTVSALEIGENYSDASYNISTIQNTTDISSRTPNNNILILLATMFASGVFGNILAIIVLARSSRDHKQTVFYRLVGALACTDLFGTCAISPISLLVYTQKITIIQGTALCNYNGFMFIFAGCSTIFIISAMAIDRYLAIRCPFFYDKNMRVGKAKYIICGVWGFAAFMGCLPIVGFGEIVLQIPNTWCFFTFTSASLSNKIFAYSYSAIGLFAISLTALSNVFVTFTLLKMRRKFRKTFNTTRRKSADSELQMMVLLLGVVVVFSVCWCPFLIRIIINQVHEEQRDILADLSALKLASLNQILDPWVYILFRKELFMRWFAFLKTRVFGNCVRICTEHPEQSTALVDHRNGNGALQEFAKDNGVVDNEYTQIKEENGRAGKEKENNIQQLETSNKEPSNGSYSPERSRNISDAGEEMPLRELSQVQDQPNQCQGCRGLNMRHSACLFCFANLSKNYAKLSIGDSKSMNDLQSDHWPSDGNDIGNETFIDNKVKVAKRNMSFTDLGFKHACKCESKKPCISLEC